MAPSRSSFSSSYSVTIAAAATTTTAAVAGTTITITTAVVTVDTQLPHQGALLVKYAPLLPVAAELREV
jgi:hypothetical protein